MFKPISGKLFESGAELELLLNLNVSDYVKPKFEKITKEVNILIKKSKHIKRYKYTIEQNLEPIEDALEGLQESLVAYEEAAKESILMGHDLVQVCRCVGSVAILSWMFKGRASRLRDKCLAMTKRGRGSGEGVEDLISNSGNDHDDDKASFSESHYLFTCSIDGT
jgi:hypothetical protein